MKMTLILTHGGREVIEVEPDKAMTDEDALNELIAMWLHALTCQTETHLLRFRSYPMGEMMVLAPDMVGGFSLRVEVMQ